MDEFTKAEARKIMSLHATLVVLGVIDTEEFLSAMMQVEEYVGIHPEYISTWGPYLHLYDLLEDDDDT